MHVTRGLNAAFAWVITPSHEARACFHSDFDQGCPFTIIQGAVFILIGTARSWTAKCMFYIGGWVLRGACERKVCVAHVLVLSPITPFL
jgi:hypothetical protein